MCRNALVFQKLSQHQAAQLLTSCLRITSHDRYFGSSSSSSRHIEFMTYRTATNDALFAAACTLFCCLADAS
jgi:hypothetical protein